MIAYIIDTDRVNFLLGRESIKKLDMMLDLPGDRIVFKEKVRKLKQQNQKEDTQ